MQGHMQIQNIVHTSFEPMTLTFRWPWPQCSIWHDLWAYDLSLFE